MEHAPQNLLDALAELFPDSSKSSLRKLLKYGRVTLDGRVEKNGNAPFRRGQRLMIHPKTVETDEGFKILFEDKHLVVVEKPAGLLSVASNFEEKETMHALLKERYKPGRVYPVHRLDQDTSGVMVFALSEEARDKLKQVFEEHAIERCYVALSEGRMEEESGTWSSYLYEDGNYVVHASEDPEKGRLAITHFQVVKRFPSMTKLLLKLETGRKNQIRVHCREAGHPIVGDKKYGARTNPYHRVCLHACRLYFLHPITGKALEFDSPSPFC